VKQTREKKNLWLAAIGVLMILMLAFLAGCSKDAEPMQVAQAPAATATAIAGMSANVFMAPGGDTLVVANGGSLEVQSGGTLSVETGATASLAAVTFTGDQTINGGLTVNGTGEFTDTLTAASGVVTAGLTVGGGYGSTGCTFSTAGVLQCDGAMTGASSLTIDSIAAGGGYGSTGCSISNAGVLQCNGAATTDGAITAATATIGGGYGSTGCSVSAAGVLQCNGAGTIDGTLTAGGDLTVSDAFTVTQASGNMALAGTLTGAGDLTVADAFTVTQASGNTALAGTLTGAGDLTVADAFTVTQSSGNTAVAGTFDAAGTTTVGGGYGSTGCSISDAGVLQCNGAATTDGALTADSGAFGGGYGSTGCSISTAGVLQCNGAATTDGAITADSAAIGGGYGSTGCSLSTAGVLQCDGAVTGASTATFADDVTVSAVTDGGNLGAKHEVIGLPRIKMVGLGQGTNPASETVDCMDDSPTGEWTELDSGTNIVLSADTSYYRYDTNSLLLAATTVVENDGISVTLPAQDDLSGLESIGFWILTDEALTSGDLDITVDDSDGTDQVYNIGAVSANVWTWVEVDISGCDANCDTTDYFLIEFTAQGAGNLTDPNIYFDELFYWDSADEDALGTAILRDGVLSIVDAESGATLVEYTDFIVHEESGNDFVVWITDQSAADVVVLLAY